MSHLQRYRSIRLTTTTIARRLHMGGLITSMDKRVRERPSSRQKWERKPNNTARQCRLLSRSALQSSVVPITPEARPLVGHAGRSNNNQATRQHGRRRTPRNTPSMGTGVQTNRLYHKCRVRHPQNQHTHQTKTIKGRRNNLAPTFGPSRPSGSRTPCTAV